MARLAGVPAGRAGVAVKLTYYFARRAMARLAGRAPERGIEPLEMFAHVPELLRAYGRLEQATAKLHRVPQRLKDLAELKAATLTSCEYCIDLGSQIARRRSDLSDEQLLALPRYREADGFTELEKLVLDYAVGMSRTPVDVPDALFARLREHFDEAESVELTYVIALENLRGRFNLALGIGAAGFSEGMVCALPESVRRPGLSAAGAGQAAAGSSLYTEVTLKLQDIGDTIARFRAPQGGSDAVAGGRHRGAPSAIRP